MNKTTSADTLSAHKINATASTDTFQPGATQDEDRHDQIGGSYPRVSGSAQESDQQTWNAGHPGGVAVIQDPPEYSASRAPEPSSPATQQGQDRGQLKWNEQRNGDAPPSMSVDKLPPWSLNAQDSAAQTANDKGMIDRSTDSADDPPNRTDPVGR